MEHVVILGAGGRLGATLCRAYADDFQVTGFNRKELDLADPKAVERRLAGLPFDLMINCAALTNVDYCETHREEARQINAEAPENLARLCQERGARFIQISTDYVFDGDAHSPYTEDDPARPISVYGESKYEGEERVLTVSPEHLIARVSWVFGPDRPSFVDQVLAKARTEKEVSAIGNKYSTPTYTLDLAEWLRAAFAARCSGILHLANGGACSWQEYAQHALDCCHRLGLPMRAKEVTSLRLEEMKNFVAARPVYTVLDNSKFTAETGVRPRDWRSAVSAYIEEHYT